MASSTTREEVTQTHSLDRAAPADPWLRYVRAVWLAVTLLAIGLSIAGIPARYAEMSHFDGYLFGNSYIKDWLYIISWEILFATLFFVAAFIIVRLRPDDWVALLLAWTLTSMGATEPGMTDALLNSYPFWYWPVFILRALAMASSILLLFVFPNGQFVPRWTRFVAACWVVFLLLCLIVPTTPTNPLEGEVWRNTPFLSYSTFLLWFGCGIYAQVYRYRQVSGWIERQQTKWTMIGLTAAVIGGFWYYGLTLTSGPNNDVIPFYVALKTPIWVILMCCAPLCIGSAILRHRLWDVDIVINRALVYSLLSASIAAVHIVTVVALSALLQSTSNLAISLPATALSAILVVPLRDRVQHGVNRLMYGERDDPAVVIARLGQQLEIALPHNAVLTTIVETLAKALRLPYAAIALPRTKNKEPGVDAAQMTTDNEPLTTDSPFDIVASYITPSSRQPRHLVIVSPCHAVIPGRGGWPTAARATCARRSVQSSRPATGQHGGATGGRCGASRAADRRTATLTRAAANRTGGGAPSYPP